MFTVMNLHHIGIQDQVPHLQLGLKVLTEVLALFCIEYRFILQKISTPLGSLELGSPVLIVPGNQITCNWLQQRTKLLHRNQIILTHEPSFMHKTSWVTCPRVVNINVTLFKVYTRTEA